MMMSDIIFIKFNKLNDNICINVTELIYIS